MWSRFVLLSALVTSVLETSAGFSQEPCPETGNLIHRSHWVRLDILGGRIAVVNRGCGQNRTTVASSPASDTRQTLSVQLQPSVLVVAYEAVDAGQRLTLEVDELRQLTIHREPVDAGVAEIHYLQPAEGKVSLLVGSHQPQKFTAESLWHLLLAEPETCRQHLLPLLDALRPNWQLGEQAAEIEQALLSASGDHLLANRKTWEALVEQLNSDDFRARQAADRALRESGQGVTTFLRQLDPHSLDAEQRRRIRSICCDLTDTSGDTPERVAAWLVNNKAVWLTLLERPAVETRVVAAEHLSKLCRHNLPFDPAANEPQRHTQLLKLRARLAADH